MFPWLLVSSDIHSFTSWRQATVSSLLVQIIAIVHKFLLVYYQDYAGYSGGGGDSYSTGAGFVDQGYNTDHGFPPGSANVVTPVQDNLHNLGSQAGTPAGLVNSNHR